MSIKNILLMIVMIGGLGGAMLLVKMTLDTRKGATVAESSTSILPSEINNAVVGTNMQVSLYVNTGSDNDKMSAGELEVRYDRSKLRYVSTTMVEPFALSKEPIDSGSGNLKIYYVSQTANKGGASEVAKLTFVPLVASNSSIVALGKILIQEPALAEWTVATNNEAVVKMESNVSPTSAEISPTAGVTSTVSPTAGVSPTSGAIDCIRETDCVAFKTCVNNSCVNRALNPISWKTDWVELTADDFYIETNGKRYFGSAALAGSTFKLHSDPADSGDPYYTTLEAEWLESGKTMRWYIYLKTDGTKWWSDEMRTYSGLDGQWVFYKNNPKRFNSDIDVPYTSSYGDFYTSDSGVEDKIYIKNIKLAVKFGNKCELQAASCKKLSYSAHSCSLVADAAKVGQSCQYNSVLTGSCNNNGECVETGGETATVSTFKFRVAMAGVMPGSKCGVDDMVKVVVKKNDGSFLNFDNVGITKVNDGDAGVTYYEGAVLVNGESLTNATLFIKGSQHLQMKYVVDGQSGRSESLNGYLNTSASKIYNFTKYPMLPGDVNGDGWVNGQDFSIVKSLAEKYESVGEGQYLKGDLDGTCQVNTRDVTLLVKSLSEKQDELY